MYLEQKYEVFSLVVGATAVNSLDWEQNQTHYFHIENCWCRSRWLDSVYVILYRCFERVRLWTTDKRIWV